MEGDVGKVDSPIPLDPPKPLVMEANDYTKGGLFMSNGVEETAHTGKNLSTMEELVEVTILIVVVAVTINASHWIYFNFGPGIVAASFIYGAEYEMWHHVPKSSLHLNDHDVPQFAMFLGKLLFL